MTTLFRQCIEHGIQEVLEELKSSIGWDDVKVAEELKAQLPYMIGDKLDQNLKTILGFVFRGNVRILAPNQVSTRDYQVNRFNLVHDPDMTITRTFWG